MTFEFCFYKNFSFIFHARYFQDTCDSQIVLSIRTFLKKLRLGLLSLNCNKVSIWSVAEIKPSLGFCSQEIYNKVFTWSVTEVRPSLGFYPQEIYQVQLHAAKFIYCTYIHYCLHVKQYIKQSFKLYMFNDKTSSNFEHSMVGEAASPSCLPDSMLLLQPRQ